MLGAATRRWSPSTAARRHERSHDSSAEAGTRPSREVKTRSHKESCISSTLGVKRGWSYAQCYPQMWITLHDSAWAGARRVAANLGTISSPTRSTRQRGMHQTGSRFPADDPASPGSALEQREGTHVTI